MPSRTSTTSPPPPERILDVDVGEEMRGSFLEYAYSVIYARALPDARDGLKPVQRRILYQAGEMGLRPDRGHVKSARVVGEVMGRLHPHGESAIYDALVRMAQPFSLRVPFIDGHGNFGSLDDGPAAMRYTECRLAPPALDMISTVHEDTVDFAANYDGREREPVVLPAAIPALLVNGATGIAVGMATNIPPHNLGEVVHAARHLIAHPQATTDDLMRFIPGPDLPAGGRIVGLDGVREAYRTGRGSFRMRASATIEQLTPRRRGIIVTELPFNVGVERVMQRIKDLHNSKKLTGIAGLTDLTDGEQGLRLVIEVKTGIDPEALLNQLYRLTPLEEQFNVNAVALVAGVPRTLGLRDMLEVFLEHRLTVVRRRSEFRRRKAEERLHLVAGLLIAILDIDEVIAVIRSSDDTAMARVRLIDIFDLTEVQANYILEMPLRRLTKFSRLELEAERDELGATIAGLTRLLEDPEVLATAVSDELAEVAAAHATPRRTVLLEAALETPQAGQLPLEFADSPCLVALDATGLIARRPLDTADEVGSVGSADAPPADRAANDAIVAVVTTTTRGHVGVATSQGRVVRLSVVELPGLPETAGTMSLVGGTDIAHFVHLHDGETVVGLLPLAEQPAALATRDGVVKRFLSDSPSNRDEWPVITLKPGDALVGAAPCPDSAELVFITSAGQLLHFPAASVRPQGRAAAGMAGVKLTSGAHVVGFAVAADTDWVATVAGDSAGRPVSAKITPLSAFPGKGRATAGVRCHRLLTGEESLVLATVGVAPVGCDPTGGAVALPAPDQRRDGSGAPIPALLTHLGNSTVASV